MPTETEKINSKLDLVLEEVGEIKSYLYNDPRTNKKGIVEQVRDIRADMDKVIENQNISTAKKTVWITVFGAIGALVIELLRVLFK